MSAAPVVGAVYATDAEKLDVARHEALAGLEEGGIPIGAALFDADGRLTDERARGFLRDFIDAFADWVASRGAVADIAS
jgi:hypothetical protein